MMSLKKAFTREQLEDVSKMTIPHHDHLVFSRVLEKFDLLKLKKLLIFYFSFNFYFLPLSFLRMLKMKESDRIDSKALYEELKVIKFC